MAEQPMTAAELREALVLVLAELRALPRDRYARAERLGWLQAHIQTIVGESPHGIEPVYGLRSLREGTEPAREGTEPGGGPPSAPAGFGLTPEHRPAGPAPEDGAS